MTDIMESAQALWRDFAAAPHGFSHEITYVNSDGHRVSPPGWVGIVRIGSSAVVASPHRLGERVERALRSMTSLDRGDLEHVAEVLDPRRTLGPAKLFYTNSAPEVDGSWIVEPVDGADARVRQVVADVSEDERDESGIDESATGLHLAIDRSGEPAALCAWTRWPHDVAHMGVLTAKSKRGHGFATAAAAHAVGRAIQQGLIAQWRAGAVNAASIAVARRLGFQELGWQYSLELRES